MASTALVGLSQPGMQVVITPRSCCFCWQRLSAVTQKSQATSSCTLPINEGYLSYFKSSQHCYCWPSSQHLLLIWIEFTPAVNHRSTFFLSGLNLHQLSIIQAKLTPALTSSEKRSTPTAKQISSALSSGGRYPLDKDERMLMAIP